MTDRLNYKLENPQKERENGFSKYFGKIWQIPSIENNFLNKLQIQQRMECGYLFNTIVRLTEGSSEKVNITFLK
jgi:hypothetical protein